MLLPILLHYRGRLSEVLAHPHLPLISGEMVCHPLAVARIFARSLDTAWAYRKLAPRLWWCGVDVGVL
jgi:hypothetical protein